MSKQIELIRITDQPKPLVLPDNEDIELELVKAWEERPLKKGETLTIEYDSPYGEVEIEITEVKRETAEYFSTYKEVKVGNREMEIKNLKSKKVVIISCIVNGQEKTFEIDL